MDLVAKTIFSFMMQSILCVLLIQEIRNEVKNSNVAVFSGINLANVNEVSVAEQLFKGVRLYLARIICVILLHIMCLKEVRVSIEMMVFARTNWKRFGKTPADSIPAFFIGFIKMFASLCTEGLNLYIVVSA